MSKYSEVIGSFIRRGDYSLEADYIFANETALKEFYAEVNAEKTVETDSKIDSDTEED
jgi:hypothetical protein